MSICHPVVVVEDQDGGDHACRHHEHDSVEVGRYNENIHAFNISAFIQTNCGIYKFSAYLIIITSITININLFTFPQPVYMRYQGGSQQFSSSLFLNIDGKIELRFFLVAVSYWC